MTTVALPPVNLLGAGDRLSVARWTCHVLAMSRRPSEMPAESSRKAMEDLVAKSRGGDGEAYRQIIDEYQSTIAAQMRRFSKDQGVIEELVHDVFVEAFVSLNSYRGRSPLLHWLRKIAVRTGYRYWKTKSKRIEQTVSLAELNADATEWVQEDTEGHRDASETLGNLLSNLPPPDRLVLTLIYWDGCSIAQAAELSGWSRAKVKIQAYRARKRLQTLIEDSLK